MTLAALPEPPYYAVIFTARRAKGDHGYDEAAARMEALAKTMPGYLGFESARNDNGFGLAVSYWESEEAIACWKQESEHLAVQKKGRRDWYEDYTVRVAKVERAYENSEQQDE